jgi:hypothetical protein
MATDAAIDSVSLSRWPDIDYQQLASRSTYPSYGRIGHSPARLILAGAIGSTTRTEQLIHDRIGEIRTRMRAKQ